MTMIGEHMVPRLSTAHRRVHDESTNTTRFYDYWGNLVSIVDAVEDLDDPLKFVYRTRVTHPREGRLAKLFRRSVTLYDTYPYTVEGKAQAVKEADDYSRLPLKDRPLWHARTDIKPQRNNDRGE